MYGLRKAIVTNAAALIPSELLK
ncbi:uncharacterized protein METZ01_LOCUS29265 [marine metagenome]|uniref:Uncharacterized protein n=1 Tax=marine metagenome TaxID=408172 RepID=A0A381QAR3_9ZZZZ